jgi:spore coat protein Y
MSTVHILYSDNESNINKGDESSMSCSDKNCVCEAVEEILDAQEAVEDQCATSCFSNLLSPSMAPGRDTIPFILYDKKGKPFKAFGNIGARQMVNGEQKCFRTFFFRVEDVKDCCATLKLLKVDNEENPEDPCDLDADDVLVKTDFCIEVDLTCFCAIQCLSPDLLIPPTR